MHFVFFYVTEPELSVEPSLFLTPGRKVTFFSPNFFNEWRNVPHLCCVQPSALKDHSQHVIVSLDADLSAASL